jgi:acyl-ACP thioesterase
VDAGFEGQGGWVVRRVRIRVERFPRFGEYLVLRTFCKGSCGFSAERRTSIATVDGSARAEAVALWICLETESVRPMPFPLEFVEIYSECAAGRDAMCGCGYFAAITRAATAPSTAHPPRAPDPPPGAAPA